MLRKKQDKMAVESNGGNRRVEFREDFMRGKRGGGGTFLCGAPKYFAGLYPHFALPPAFFNTAKLYIYPPAITTAYGARFFKLI
jgi:hypothetical protein